VRANSKALTRGGVLLRLTGAADFASPTLLWSKVPIFFIVIRSKTVGITANVSCFLTLLVVNAAPVKAECGMDKPFRIQVQESYHTNRVTAPMVRCKTKEVSCTTSGTIFIVSANRVQYAILLLDGVAGKLKVGESYSAFLSCQKSPMMIAENKEGKPIVALYVLEQRSEPRKAPPGKVNTHFATLISMEIMR
jgi:hypothetical protein